MKYLKKYKLFENKFKNFFHLEEEHEENDDYDTVFIGFVGYYDTLINFRAIYNPEYGYEISLDINKSDNMNENDIEDFIINNLNGDIDDTSTKEERDELIEYHKKHSKAKDFNL